jgi:hypothetical protein
MASFYPKHAPPRPVCFRVGRRRFPDVNVESVAGIPENSIDAADQASEPAPPAGAVRKPLTRQPSARQAGAGLRQRVSFRYSDYVAKWDSRTLARLSAPILAWGGALGPPRLKIRL